MVATSRPPRWKPKFWMAFCAGVGLEAELSALVPGPHQVELKAKLAAIFLGKSRDEWAAFGALHDCCLEPVLEPDEIARGMRISPRAERSSRSILRGERSRRCPPRR